MTKADTIAAELAKLYIEQGQVAAQARMNEHVAAGLKTFEYVAITDKLRKLVGR